MEGVEKRHGTRDAQASVGASVLPPLLTLHDPVAVRSRRAHVARARLATAVRRHGDERRERTESSCAFRLRKRRKKVRESTKDDVTFSFDLYSLSLVSNTDFSTCCSTPRLGPFLLGPIYQGIAPLGIHRGARGREPERAEPSKRAP